MSRAMLEFDRPFRSQALLDRSSETPQDLKQYRIFVVDDEPMIAETLGIILRQQGYMAYVFGDPAEALAAASEMAPDLQISDVMMPILTRIGLALQICEFCSSCKVILFSGHPAPTGLLDNARSHGQDFEALAKPVHPATFLDKILSVMMRQWPRAWKRDLTSWRDEQRRVGACSR